MKLQEYNINVTIMLQTKKKFEYYSSKKRKKLSLQYGRKKISNISC